MSDQLSHLPDWAQTRCARCGEYALPDSGIVYFNGNPGVHITEAGCDRNKARMETLAIEAILMHQALVEARQTLGRFVNECEEDNWNDEVAGAVMSTMASTDRGLDASKLVAFKAEEIV